MNPRPRKLKVLRWLPNRWVLTRGARRDRVLYLTFNDGPHPQHTPPLPALLAQHRVRATFFLIGQQAERHPELVRQIVRGGRVLGNHCKCCRRCCRYGRRKASHSNRCSWPEQPAAWNPSAGTPCRAAGRNDHERMSEYPGAVLNAAVFTAACALLLAAAVVALVARDMRKRNMHLWLRHYLRRRVPTVTDRPVHVMFCFVDHFEPMWKGADLETQRRRVDRWCTEYRALAGRHRDADGRPPQHSFFYPEEEYAEEHLDKLASLCSEGFGEIEVHLHHDNDTEQNFRVSIGRFCKTLHEKHGALPRDPETGELKFGFIHGNWCLDNSRADGRWCGIDNELILLRELGCYADFTLPSAPSDTQTATVNSIYYATDDPLAPKSHNTGAPVKVGGGTRGDLMIVQGPLALNWRERRMGAMPRIENADVRKNCPPTEARVDLWVKTGVHVEGRPEWVFVKIHTHGTQEHDIDTLLGEPVDAMHRYLESRYNDGKRHVLHYVTSREAYNIIKAAEAGEQGDPGQYRDYLLPPPRASWAGGRKAHGV